MTKLTSAERNALAQIETIEDPARLRNLIENARRQKSHVVEAAAFQRLCFVQPEATPGTIEHDVWQSIHALEEMLLEERGRTTRLSRTRQKIARHGEAKTASDLTMKADASAGFRDLLARGHPELTFEAIVLKHPKTFDEEVQEAAEARLRDAGVDTSKFTEAAGG